MDPIIIPTQATPPQDSGSRLFNRAWFLALDSMAGRLNNLINAGGDLSGTYPNPTVIGLQTRTVSDAAPSDGDVLTWVAADEKWEPQPNSGGFNAGAWTTYTPTTTNLSSVTSVQAASNQSGKTCFVRIRLTGTSNGSNPTITLPFTPAAFQTFACTITAVSGGATVPGWVTLSGSTLTIGFYNNSAFGASASYIFTITGVYETT